jgi:hypothetical protein
MYTGYMKINSCNKTGETFQIFLYNNWRFKKNLILKSLHGLYCKRTILAILKSILGSQLLTLTLTSSSDLSWMREIQPLVLNGTKVWL